MPGGGNIPSNTKTHDSLPSRCGIRGYDNHSPFRGTMSSSWDPPLGNRTLRIAVPCFRESALILLLTNALLDTSPRYRARDDRAGVRPPTGMILSVLGSIGHPALKHVIPKGGNTPSNATAHDSLPSRCKILTTTYLITRHYTIVSENISCLPTFLVEDILNYPSLY